MKLDTADLRNIHFQSTAAASSAESTPPLPIHCKKITRSPNEEYQARVARFGAPEPVPNDLAAIIVSAKGDAEVTPDGITIYIDKEPHRYWHQESRTCLTQVGKKAFFVRSRNFTECIHIVDSDGRYVETLPLYNNPDWFSAEAKEQLKATRRVVTQIHEDLKKTHRLTTAQQVDRAKSTRETLQHIVDIQPPVRPEGRPALVGDRAADLADAMTRTAEKATAAKARSARQSDVNVAEVLSRRAAELKTVPA